MLTEQQGRRWLDRWDRQQETYMADREERFAVIGDVLDSVVDRPDPLVVDLGAGPGSLSVRLLDRIPGAEVVAVDADRLLLGLARAAYADRPGLRLVEADLRSSDWVQALGLARAPDAMVSTTALHWLTGPELRDVYGHCGSLLAAGGVLVNGDHFADQPEQPRLDQLTRAVRQQRAGRVGLAPGEDWEAWWEAVGDAPELADLQAERGPRPIDHRVATLPSLADHLRLLSTAGFAEAGVVWQHGDDRVVVALR